MVKEFISRLWQMHINKQNQIENFQVGNICAAVRLKDKKTGDTLTLENDNIVLGKMIFPGPVIIFI